MKKGTNRLSGNGHLPLRLSKIGETLKPPVVMTVR